MQTEIIVEKVKEFITDELYIDAEQVKTGHKLVDDLALDSLDMLEIIVRLEEELEVAISDEEAQAWVTVQDIITAVEQKASAE